MLIELADKALYEAKNQERTARSFTVCSNLCREYSQTGASPSGQRKPSVRGAVSGERAVPEKKRHLGDLLTGSFGEIRQAVIGIGQRDEFRLHTLIGKENCNGPYLGRLVVKVFA